MTMAVRLALILPLGARLSSSASIQSEDMRVTASEHNSRYYLTFSSRAVDGGWRTILGTGALASRVWLSDKTITIEDPRIEWKSSGEVHTADAFFSRATKREDGRTLVLSGQAAGHEIEETITIAAPHRIHVTVRDRADAQIDLGQLMSHFCLIPNGRAEGYSLPLEFAWLPVLDGESDHYCSDHFFRSPSAIAMSHGAYAALVPDLDLLAIHRPIPHSLDLRVVGVAGQVPRLSYGISTSVMVEHTFSQHAVGQTKTLKGSEIAYGFDIFLGEPAGGAAFRYANGVEVRLELPRTKENDDLQGGARFIGEKGKIDIWRNNLKIDAPGVELDLPPAADIQKWHDERALWQAQYHMSYWLECIPS